MKILGEVFPADSYTKESYIWDGKVFRPKLRCTKADWWILRGKTVSSLAFPWVRVLLRRFKWTLIGQGQPQNWYLDFSPIKLVCSTSGKKWIRLKGKIWESTDGERFIVKGMPPLWALLIAFEVPIFEDI